jgi:3-oxoacyl-[acyl-carrier protein] reductase
LVRTVDDTKSIDREDGIDILVTLPQPIIAQPIGDVSDEAYAAALERTVRPVFVSTRAVLPKMQQRSWGRIIHVVWGQAVGAMRNVSVDSSAAAAVNQFSRAIGIECARSGVTVNTIALGWFQEIGLSNLPSLERYIPLRRLGNADDLGALLIYLASDQASYVTAHTHLLDGGLRSRG